MPKDYLSRYLIDLRNHTFINNQGKEISFEQLYSTVYHANAFNNGITIQVENGRVPKEISRDGIEIEDNGDIRICPVSCSGANNNILFFNDDEWLIELRGKRLSDDSKIFIYDKIVPIYSCLWDVNYNDINGFIPYNYTNLYNSIFLTYQVFHYFKRPPITYPEPEYTSTLGKSFDTNNGITKKAEENIACYISLIDKETIEATHTVPLKNIDKPSFRLSKSNLYIYNTLKYSYYYVSYQPTDAPIVAMDGYPIYVIDRETFDIKAELIPGDGDVYCDIQETEKYIILCGTNQKHGYVGYHNPTIVILDKSTYQEVARYTNKEKKGYIYLDLFVIDEDTLFLEYCAGDRQYTAASGKIGRDVVRISSLL